MKITVFDFDETIGYFSQFSIFWECLKTYTEKELNQTFFNELLDLYPHFFRPIIFKVFIYIKKQKEVGSCNKVMIYTNNTGAHKWVNYFVNYIHQKIDFKLFDRIIAAFKVKGNIIELCRSTKDKNLDDLIKCSKLPKHTEICFIDDTYFPNMINDQVYYINVKPYFYNYSFHEMMDLLQSNNKLNYLCKKNFEKYFSKLLKSYNYKVFNKSADDQEIDLIVSKQLFAHVKTFFN